MVDGPVASRIRLQPGSPVLCRGKRYFIVSVLDLEVVLAEEVVSRLSERLPIADLEPVPAEVASKLKPEPEITTVVDNDWKIAQERLDAIQPLLQMPYRTKKNVQNRAKELDLNTATLYRWIKAFQATGRLSALLPAQVSKSRGKPRFEKKIEDHIKSAIKQVYKPPTLSIKETYDRAKELCEMEGLEPPSLGTVRNRIMTTSDEEKFRRRRGKRAARDKFDPAVSKFPGATTPLSVIQIDHTLLRPMLVDDEYRLPIGRPWLTLAIDVFSRVIYGMYLSLEAPSAMSTGLCLVHGMLPKDKWLAARGVTERWPVWGIPGTVHSDNGGDFRGDMLKLAAKNLRFILAWRPVKNPKYGGHIESLCGTLKEDLDREVPGVVPEHLSGKEYYDAEKEAALTFTELEVWLAEYVAREYNQRRHSGIGTAPLKRFEEGIFGTDDQPAVGLPDLPFDERTIRFNLTPYEERTVQQYGILWDGIYYYSDVLRPWINATVPGSTKKTKRKFIVRRDPRNVSSVYFYDPDLREHFDIPYRNPSHPAITLWELQACRQYLIEKGVQEIDEDALFRARLERRQRVEKAKAETKRIRKQTQREKLALAGAAQHRAAVSNGAADQKPVDAPKLNYENVKPFDDIDELKIHD